MRVRLSRAVFFFIIATVCFLLWIINQYRQPNFSRTCMHPVSFQNNLHSMAFRVSHVLDVMSFTHCLCYGALWGQVRRARNLPWESDIEFCIRNEELSSYDENFIAHLFQKHDLTLSYDSAEGIYSVTDQNFQPGASIKLVVFEKISEVDMMRRIGWKRRILPPNCEDVVSLECFPARLMLEPLPRKDFGGKLLPVPREDIEILKYHYADNWWLEVLPFNC